MPISGDDKLYILCQKVNAGCKEKFRDSMAQNVNVVIHFSTNRQGNLAKIALPSVIMCGCCSLLQKGVVARCGPHQKMLLLSRKFKCQYRAAAWHCVRHQAPQILWGGAVIKEPVTNEIDEPVKLIIRERRRIRHERVNEGQDRLNWPQWAS